MKQDPNMETEMLMQASSVELLCCKFQVSHELDQDINGLKSKMTKRHGMFANDKL